MPIDASIYSQAKGFEMPDVVGAMTKAMTLSQLAKQNRALAQTEADQNAVKAAFVGNVNADGTINRPAALSALAKSAPMQAVEYGTKFAEMDKNRAEADQRVLEDSIQQQGLIAHLAGHAKDQQSYDQAIAAAGLLGLNTSKFPKVYDPNMVQSLQTASLKMKERMEARKIQSDVGIAEGKAPAELAKITSETAKNKAETRKIENEVGGKPMAAEQTDKIAGHDASLKTIQDLRSTLAANGESFGPVVGRLATWNPYDAQGQQVSALFKKAAQTIGKSLEGGKLTDQDYAKYEKMLPTMNDTPETASAKLDQLERMVAMQRNADLNAYGKAGLNVRNFSTTTPTEIAIANRPGSPITAGIPEAMADSSNPHVKTIGGRTYIKVNGGWKGLKQPGGAE